jgi:L-fuconolactonase
MVTVTPRRRRFVDSHLHLWDAREHPWYSFPQPGDDSFGLGLTKSFPDRYLWHDYLESVSSVDLVKWVHVSALTTPRDAEAESAWVESIAHQSERPYALIGTLDPTLPLSEIAAALDREMANSVYRGLRFLGGLDYESARADAIFNMLSSRKLVFDAVASTGGIRTAARGLARHPTLTVVLEHVGWPRATTSEHFDAWRAEMADFAALPNTFCKLSGLSMVVHRADFLVFQKFFDECIRLFGVQRCMFGSNFPIDLSYGSGDDLLRVFDEIASTYSPAQAESLFASTAERVYRL